MRRPKRLRERLTELAKTLSEKDPSETAATWEEFIQLVLTLEGQIGSGSVEILTGDGFKKVEFGQVKLGDIFRSFNTEGIPTLQGGKSVLIATRIDDSVEPPVIDTVPYEEK